MERLSSGVRINAAVDDAAGLVISQGMQAQIGAGNAQLRNINDMVSMTQVVDSTLAAIGDDLQRIRTLAVQAANGTLNAADRAALQVEVAARYRDARNLQQSTSYNGHALLDGSLQLQTGGDASGAAVSLAVPALFLPKTTDVLYGYVQMAQASVTATPSAALSSGDLLLSGHPVPPTQAGPAAGQDADSAWALANAINTLSSKGYDAQANPASVSGAATVPPLGDQVAAGDITINGVATRAGNVVNAINAIAAQTGVTASQRAVSGSGANTAYVLSLSAADGRNISVSGAAGFGLADTQVACTVSISGPLTQTPEANLVISGANPAAAGLVTSTVQAQNVGDPTLVLYDASSGYDLNPHVDSVPNATATINAMDGKLDALNALRVQVGAAENALTQRSSDLTQQRDSTQQAQSQIRDADFATEVASLTSDNIVQTSSLAMIAQANASPGVLLSILLGHGS